MKHLSIVLVEDDPGDARLIHFTLKHSHHESTLHWVNSLAELDTYLQQGNAVADVILLDLSLPDSSGIQTVLTCKQLAGGTPIVVLTGYDDATFSLEVLEAGAQDYLIKGAIDADSLHRAIRYAMSRAKLEQRLILSEERMTAAIEGGKLGIWDWLFDQNAFVFSERWLATLGFSRERAETQEDATEWLERIHPDDRSLFELAVERHLKGDVANYQCEFRMLHDDGHWVWVFESGHVVSWDANQKPLRMVGVQQDISERKAMEEQLTYLAMHDELTGLLNRRSFMELAGRELTRLKRKKEYDVCLIMLDLDHFKSINDIHGHAAGDDVLKCFSLAITRQLRQMDVFARLGGEEFVVMLPDTHAAGGAIVAEKLRCAIETMQAPSCSVEASLSVTASLGVTQMLRSDIRADGSLARADKALYSAKNRGRNQVCVYEET